MLNKSEAYQKFHFINSIHSSTYCNCFLKKQMSQLFNPKQRNLRFKLKRGNSRCYIALTLPFHPFPKYATTQRLSNINKKFVYKDVSIN